MKVTIEGTIDQVHEALTAARSVVRRKAKHGESSTAKRNAEIQRRRAIICRAFKIVRYDSTRKELADDLLSAIGGRASVTDELIQRAEELLS